MGGSIAHLGPEGLLENLHALGGSEVANVSMVLL